MPSALKRAIMSFKKKTNVEGNRALNIPGTPTEQEWKEVGAILSTSKGTHVSACGQPPVVKLKHGVSSKGEEILRLGSRAVEYEGKTPTYCYFGHQVVDDMYYLSANGGQVSFQKFEKQPDLQVNDGRIFELVMNDTWCQFRTPVSGMYMSSTDAGLCLQKKMGPDLNYFNFDLLRT